MVRAPCCEKMGLKRGPWTQDEDAVLVSYIHRHGHGNWRALPKLAGLLRCGKSCRLRWTNYLRPDIKRGNFTEEEEDMIINLHEMLGNRWSAIAARLPGRTDNEIKNVWHTHLKKRLKPAHKSMVEPKKRRTEPESRPEKEVQSENTSFSPAASSDSGFSSSCTDSSSLVIENASDMSNLGNESMDFTSQELFEIDESFWNEALSMGCTEPPADVATGQNGTFSLAGEQLSSDGLCNDEDINFWLKIFMESGDLPEL